MSKLMIVLLSVALLGGCATTYTKPANQTYLLNSVRAKLGQLRVSMTKVHVRKILGAPALIDDRGPNLVVWFYLPDKPSGFALQYPEKIRIIFTGEFYSRYSFETTYAADYGWEF